MKFGILFLIALTLGCAHQAPPPGGPEDTTPPQIVGSFPPPDTAGIDPEVRIALSFSEGMDKRSVEEAIFISPPLDDPPRFRWHKRELTIEPPSPFSRGRTYVITVGTNAQDLRGNRFLQSFTLAFSTGDSLDRGAISGTVFDQGQPRAGVSVMAYFLEGDPDPTEEIPAYVTQTGHDGRYLLSYLGTGSYRLFALDDRNNDRLYEPAEEALAIPPADPSLSESLWVVERLNFSLSLKDTTRPTLISARPLDSRTIMLRFDQEMDPVTLFRADNYTLTSEEGSRALSFVYPIHSKTDRVALFAARQLSNLRYHVSVAGLANLDGTSVDSAASRAEFVGVTLPDTVKPTVMSTFPEDGAAHVPLTVEVRFLFSEPMEEDSVQRAFSLIDTAGLSTEVDLRWEHPNGCVFSPRKPLHGLMAYRARLGVTRARDLAGNPLADSSVVISFTTLNPDTLGSISGQIALADTLAGRPVVVIAEQPSGLTFEAIAEDSMDYHMREMMPGRYTLRAFLDRNQNRRFDFGSLVPFRPAEPFTIYPDTVFVRSRWETAGVDLRFGPIGDRVD